MKKIKFNICAILLIIFLSTALCACDNASHTPGVENTINYPLIKEYALSQVLDVAQNKYNLKEYVYNDVYRLGYKPGEVGLLTFLPFDVVNPDNLYEAALSFEGVIGGYSSIMAYSGFACYLTLAIDNNGNYKFIIFNTNINKDQKIEHAIGCADYTGSLLFDEIANLPYSNEISHTIIDDIRTSMKNGELFRFYFCADGSIIFQNSIKFKKIDDTIVFQSVEN